MRLPFTSPFTTYCSSPRNERVRKRECKHKSFCSVNGLDNLRYCLTSPKRAQFSLQFWKARIAAQPETAFTRLTLARAHPVTGESGLWQVFEDAPFFMPTKNRGKQELLFSPSENLNKTTIAIIWTLEKLTITNGTSQEIRVNEKVFWGKKGRNVCLWRGKVRYSGKEFEWDGHCSRIKSRTTHRETKWRRTKQKWQKGKKLS